MERMPYRDTNAAVTRRNIRHNCHGGHGRVARAVPRHAARFSAQPHPVSRLATAGLNC